MAECMYYDSQDIQTILKVGKHKANEIMHMFDQRGQLFKCGKTFRIKRRYFEEWLEEMDGEKRRAKAVADAFQRTDSRRRKR